MLAKRRPRSFTRPTPVRRSTATARPHPSSRSGARQEHATRIAARITLLQEHRPLIRSVCTTDRIRLRHRWHPHRYVERGSCCPAHCIEVYSDLLRWLGDANDHRVLMQEFVAVEEEHAGIFESAKNACHSVSPKPLSGSPEQWQSPNQNRK